MNSPVQTESEPVREAPGSAAEWSAKFTGGRVCGLIILFLFALYPGVLLGSHSFFHRDFGLFTYPVAYYTHESFWHGEVPLWNPLVHSGVPFLAQWNTSVCYPASWCYILLPLPWSLNIFCLGHLVLGGAGMYALARHWTQNRFAASAAAVAFALSGVMLNCLIWTSNLAALSWQPLVILCVEQAWRKGGRKIGWAALAAAMQMLAGAPEIILFTWAILGVLALTAIRQKAVAAGLVFRRVAAVVALVAGLSAVQILPFLDLLTHSDRHSTFQMADAWPMPLWGWANLLVPLFHASRTALGFYFQDGQSWTSSYYLGTGVLALALVGIIRVRDARARWLAIAMVAGLVLALGNEGLIYRWLKAVVPAIGFARYPIKFVALATFAIPLLAAYGLANFQKHAAERGGKNDRLLLGVGGLLLGAVGLILIAANRFPKPGDSWAATWHSGIASAGFLVAILLVLAMSVRARSARRGALLGFIALILVGLDAITAGSHQNPTVVTKAFGPLELNMSSRPRFGESRAMLSAQAQAFFASADTADPMVYCLGIRGALFKNCNLREEIPKADGFVSLHLKEEADVRPLFYQTTNSLAAGLADFAGVAQVSAPDDVFAWQSRGTGLPLVTAGQKAIFAGAPETLDQLRGDQFDPRRDVFLPTLVRGEVTATNATDAKVTGGTFAAHRISFSVNASAPALVVIAQSYHHNWQAMVDGRPVSLWRANHAYQALEVPAGRHEVLLVYRDAAFRWGLILSVVALLGCIGVIVRGSRAESGGSARP